jgi:tetratricopeptide (TPR) repeat protein
MVHYITIFVWPFAISVEYDWKLVKGFFALDCIVPFCLLLGLAGYTVYRLYKNRIDRFAFAVLWFFITILPRSTIIPSSELLADYKTYVSSLAPVFLLATAFLSVCHYGITCGTLHLPTAHHLYIKFVCIFLCLLFLGNLTYERNKVWKSTEAFWGNILYNAPGKARAYTGYGAALVAQGNSKDAIPYYQKAIALESGYSDGGIMFDIFTWNNLAVAYSAVGELDKAIETLKGAILIQPNYPELYNNIAIFLIAKKDFIQAEQALNCAIQLRPHFGQAWLNKGKIYVEQGKPLEAFECFKNACTQADADDQTGFGAYASISIDLKKYDDAIYAFKKLIELNPCKQNMLWLAAAYFENNNICDAIAVYQKILHTAPHEFIALHKIGEAYVRLHEWEKALNYFIRAYSLNQSASHSALQIAHCLMQLERYAQAQKHLEILIAQDKLDEGHKNLARAGLIELQRYIFQ